MEIRWSLTVIFVVFSSTVLNRRHEARRGASGSKYNLFTLSGSNQEVCITGSVKNCTDFSCSRGLEQVSHDGNIGVVNSPGCDICTCYLHTHTLCSFPSLSVSITHSHTDTRDRPSSLTPGRIYLLLDTVCVKDHENPVALAHKRSHEKTFILSFKQTNKDKREASSSMQHVKQRNKNEF